MKYAIYGGSFNPFGNNHQDIVRWLLTESGFDKVYVVPSAAHAQKSSLPDYMHRLNMTKLGVRDLKYGIPSLPKGKEAIVSDIEMHMAMTQCPPIYTWDLLNEMEKIYFRPYKGQEKPEIKFAIGPDVAAEVDDWKFGKEVKEKYGFVEIPLFGVRATELRQMIAEQPFQSWKRHVPLSVGGYIQDHGLYQKKTFSYSYPLPAVATDMVIFSINKKDNLSVLLIKRRDHAKNESSWALPGGFVEVGKGYMPTQDQGESLDAAAKRELKEETSLDCEKDNIFLEQLYTFGDPNRDKRGRVISVAYYSLIGYDIAPGIRAGDDAKEAQWFDIDELPELDFDHSNIVKIAIERIRGKLDYDPRIAKGLLPQEFTATEFRKVHEVVKGQTYDRSNFRKRFNRMIEDNKLEKLEETTKDGVGRPSQLYRFKGE